MKWTVVLLFALITFSAHAQSVTPPPRDEELCAAGGRSHGWAPSDDAADVRLAINQRHHLEHLCRYITRPAIANERLTLNKFVPFLTETELVSRGASYKKADKPWASFAIEDTRSSPARTPHRAVLWPTY